MGVSSVLRLPIDRGTTPSQMLDLYIDKVESIGGKKEGTYSVECETYKFNENIVGLQEPRLLHLFLSSEHPATAFSIIETNQNVLNRQAPNSIVCDSTFDKIISNLSNYFEVKQFHDMKVQGFKLVWRDFVIKLGTCSMASQAKAIICEVEYTASPHPCDCVEIIKDVFHIIIGPNHPFDIHNFLAPHMKEKFTPFLAIHQYYDIFNQIKRQSQQDTAMQGQQQSQQQSQSQNQQQQPQQSQSQTQQPQTQSSS